MSLHDKSALIIGFGGLGGPAAIGLAAAGIGRLTLLDPDRVDATNLGRQVLFGDADVGELKVAVGARALVARFPTLRVEARAERFGRSDAMRQLISRHDVVLDGTDNFQTRFAVNDDCVELGVPLVHGAALRWLGQVLVIQKSKTPCLRCIFEREPEGVSQTCADAGVFSPLVGLIGAWMAEAAVALLEGNLTTKELVFRVFDAWQQKERFAKVGRDPSCSSCG